MGEPSFLELSRRPGRCYRFLWLRTWHSPISARICRVDELGIVELRLLDGFARPGVPHRLRASRRVVIDAAEWELLEARVQAAGFWEAPRPNPLLAPEPEEGSRWVFEGVQDGRVQVVDLYTPEEAEWVDLGLYMMALGGVRVPEREVY